MTKLGKIVLPIFAVLIVFAAVFCFLAARAQDPAEFSMSICASGWEDKITYSMLSDELKEIVSEKNFPIILPKRDLLCTESWRILFLTTVSIFTVQRLGGKLLALNPIRLTVLHIRLKSR